MQKMQREKLRELQDGDGGLAVVDVLDESEYKKYHLPGAINVPLGDDFEDRIQEAVPDKSTTVVVYCQDEKCPASAEAAERMEEAGYEDVYDYAGGKDDWKEAGLSVVAGPQTG